MFFNMMMLLILVFILSCNSYQISTKTISFNRITRLYSNTDSTPMNNNDIIKTTISNTILNSIVINSLLLSKPKNANAIGNLYELSNEPMIFQDVSFNVLNTYNDAIMFQSLFQDTCQTIRSSSNKGINTTTISFGADAYKSPSTFRPGISSYAMDGGHATITLLSKDETDQDVQEIFSKGNGLQYIKFGSELLRLSKGVENGANIKFAYGWVDLDTPNNIPVKVVVGIRRDPLMCVCIAVSNIDQTVKFLSEELGMKQMPLPLARNPGSEFEPQPQKGDVYMGYTPDTMGFLLTPVPKGARLSLGTQLNGFNIIVDDKAADKLPPSIQELIANKNNKKIIESPDGYKFIITPYSEFEKYSTSKSFL